MFTDWKGITAGGVIAVAVLWYVSRKVGAAVEEKIDDVLQNDLNPVSGNNLAYRATSAITDVLDDGSSNGSNSLGTLIYEWTHSEE